MEDSMKDLRRKDRTIANEEAITEMKWALNPQKIPENRPYNL
jgi:hypothetical protein